MNFLSLVGPVQPHFQSNMSWAEWAEVAAEKILCVCNEDKIADDRRPLWSVEYFVGGVGGGGAAVQSKQRSNGQYNGGSL